MRLHALPIHRVRFGNEPTNEAARQAFLKTVSESAGDDSPAAIRKKQKALLNVVEKNIDWASRCLNDTWADTVEEMGVRATVLLLYERLLSALLESRPKSDPLENLERLERLIKTVGEQSTAEGKDQ